MERLKKFRYFTDSEGYMFILMDTGFSGVILNNNEDYEGFFSCPLFGKWVTDVLSEIDPAYFNESFIIKIETLSQSHEVLKDVVEDLRKQNRDKSDKKNKIPKSVVDAIKERIALLERKIPEYRYDAGAFLKDECMKSGMPRGAALKPLLEKYPRIIKSMTVELNELKKFLADFK